MTALIALFALAFQLCDGGCMNLQSASNPKAVGDCYTSKSGPLVITEGVTFAQCEAMKGMWHQRKPDPPPKRPKCEVVYVHPGEQGSMESLEEALANNEGQWLTICRPE